MICIECGHHNELSARACEHCAAALREHQTGSGSSLVEEEAETVLGSEGGERRSSELPPNQIGDRLGEEGRYEILSEVGRGGMGVVHLARDRRFTDALGGLDRRVVVKRILELDEAAVTRFLRETRAIAVLEHENIVHIHDFGEDERGPFIVMGHVDGGTLKSSIREDGPFGDEAFYELARGLGRALDFVHEHHILHRDVKPSNVLLTRDGLPKLSDFGLVRIGGDSDLSATGHAMGTADYAAPEQRRGERNVDHRADLYGLGATLYFAVTGEVPRTIRESRIPERWRGLVLRCVEEKPEDRFEDAKAFLEALEDARDSSDSGPVGAAPVDGTRCANCGAINRVGENYCRQCGAGMYRACPSCREVGEASASFCVSCGLDVGAWFRSEEHLRSALEHLEAGHFEEAVYEGRRAEESFTGRAEVRDLLKEANRKRTALLNAWDLAEVHDRAERYEQARRAWMRVLSFDPSHKRARAALAAQPELLRKRDLNRAQQTVLEAVEARAYERAKDAFDALLELAREEDAARIAPVEQAFHKLEKRVERLREAFERAIGEGDESAAEAHLEELVAHGEASEAVELGRRRTDYLGVRRELRTALDARELDGAKTALERLVSLAEPESREEVGYLRAEVRELRDALLGELAESFEALLAERQLEGADTLRARFEELGGDPETLDGLERLARLRERAAARRLWMRRGARSLGTGGFLLAVYLLAAVMWNKSLEAEAWSRLRSGDLAGCANQLDRALPLPPLRVFASDRLGDESTIARRRSHLEDLDRFYGAPDWRAGDSRVADPLATPDEVLDIWLAAVRADFHEALAAVDLRAAGKALEPISVAGLDREGGGESSAGNAASAGGEPAHWDHERTRERFHDLLDIAARLERAPAELIAAFDARVREVGTSRGELPEPDELRAELAREALAAGRRLIEQPAPNSDREQGVQSWRAALEALEASPLSLELGAAWDERRREERLTGSLRTLRDGGFDVLTEIRGLLEELGTDPAEQQAVADLALFQAELVSPEGLGALGHDRLADLDRHVHEALPEGLAARLGGTDFATAVPSLDERLRPEFERRLRDMFAADSYRVGANRRLSAASAIPGARVTVDGVELRSIEPGVYEVPAEVPEGERARELVVSLGPRYSVRIDRTLVLDTTAPSLALEATTLEVLEGQDWTLPLPPGGDDSTYDLDPPRDHRRVEGDDGSASLVIAGVSKVPPGHSRSRTRVALVAVDSFGNRSEPIALELLARSERFTDARALVEDGEGREAWSHALALLAPDLAAEGCDAEVRELALAAATIGLRGSLEIRNAGLHQHGLERETDSKRAEARLGEYRNLIERTRARIAAVLGDERLAAATDPRWDLTSLDESGTPADVLERALSILAARATELASEADRLLALLKAYNAGGSLGALDATSLAGELDGLQHVAAPAPMQRFVRASIAMHERARGAGFEDVVVPRATDWRLWGEGAGSLPRRIRFPGANGIDFVFVPATQEGTDGFFLGETELTVQNWRRLGGRELQSGSLLLPVSGITWTEADAWCRAARLRLPTVAEWAAAASRPDWSNSFNEEGCARSVAITGVYEAGRGAGGLPSDRTWCGALDMLGNVMEWTADMAATAGSRVLCGACWQNQPTERTLDRRSTRGEKEPGLPTIGFRPLLRL